MKRTMLTWAVPLLLLSQVCLAQDAAAPPPLKPEELEQLVAPIALYPDDLLSQVLIASTYPLEVVEANRWAKASTALTGDARKTALEKQTWDANVKSLTTTPSVLATMSDKLDWTQKLGDAVLAQQADVMDAVQRLRTKAVAQKTLTTTPQQKVETTVVENKQVVVIEPAQPNTVYVPYYDPTVVYGTWAYPAYPPAYYPPPPGYAVGSALVSGIAFGTGIAIAGAIWGDNDFNWGHGDINVNVNNNFINNRHINNRPGENGSGTRWQHDPAHRHGVQYNSPALRQKFSGAHAAMPGAGDARTRLDFRGHDGQQVLNPARHAAPAARLGQGGGGTRQSIPPASRTEGMHNITPAAGRAAPERSGFASGGFGEQGGGMMSTHRDVSGIGGRSNNAFAGIHDGAATRAQSERGRASLGGGMSGGGGRAGGGRLGRRR